jgi:dephospho-CoA kinase
MLIVGLAGGIATGKSLVAREAATLPSVAVLDADKVAWETYLKGTSVYTQLVTRFGEKILAEDGQIDRKKLGAIIFSDASARQFLNSIVHPAVGVRLYELAEEHRAQGIKILVIETALLLESEYAIRRFYDYVILVKADAEAQVQRLIARGKITRQEAERKVRARIPIEEQIAKADFVLDTSGSIKETKEKARALFMNLLSQGSSVKR